ncbi:MAG: sugar phosphate isomerase/epimerase [Lachnospiraceae bacterium]|nr:sugar phosphate isomerase/epimerase [Lachnospiraceae bacterium]
MQVGIRFHDLAAGTLEERAAFAHAQGFKCTHIALSKIGPYKMTLPELTPGWAMHVRHVLEGNGLDTAVLGCYLNLGTPDEAALKNTQEVYKAHLRFASILGAAVVGTETGAVNTGYKFEEANRSEAALETFIRNLEPVVRAAEKTGTILAIEPVYKHIVYSPARARRVLDAIASPNLQIIFDPVNLLGMDNYERRDEIFAEAMELLKNEIAIIHIKDFKVENGNLVSIAAGTGEMNYEKIIEFAETYKPYIQATLENTTPDNAVMARQYIENIAKKYH